MADTMGWFLLQSAVQFYQNIGEYIYVDTPWIVRHKTLMITCPRPEYAMTIVGSGRGLVGSAEQGFLELERLGTLGRGKFVSCGPCFRNEAEDDLHRQTFMKVELYRNDKVDEEALEEMIADATYFFQWNLGRQKVERVATDDGFDLMLNGIEIGSYGIRHHDDLHWVYGTGLAMPRFAMAKERAA